MVGLVVPVVRCVLCTDLVCWVLLWLCWVCCGWLLIFDGFVLMLDVGYCVVVWGVGLRVGWCFYVG